MPFGFHLRQFPGIREEELLMLFSKKKQKTTIFAPLKLKRAAILKVMNMSDRMHQSNPENNFDPCPVNSKHSNGNCTEQLTFKKNTNFRI